MPENTSQMNPQERELTIGVRVLRKIKIYPLSMRDQFKLMDSIVEVVGAMFSGGAMSDELFISGIIGLLRKEIEHILPLITDTKENEDLLADITTNQAVELGKIVYEMNYDFLADSVASLAGLRDQLFPKSPQEKSSTGPSPKSADNTNTDPEKSSTSDTEKAD